MTIDVAEVRSRLTQIFTGMARPMAQVHFYDHTIEETIPRILRSKGRLDLNTRQERIFFRKNKSRVLGQRDYIVQCSVGNFRCQPEPEQVNTPARCVVQLFVTIRIVVILLRPAGDTEEMPSISLDAEALRPQEQEIVCDPPDLYPEQAQQIINAQRKLGVILDEDVVKVALDSQIDHYHIADIPAMIGSPRYGLVPRGDLEAAMRLPCAFFMNQRPRVILPILETSKDTALVQVYQADQRVKLTVHASLRRRPYRSGSVLNLSMVLNPLSTRVHEAHRITAEFVFRFSTPQRKAKINLLTLVLFMGWTKKQFVDAIGAILDGFPGQTSTHRSQVRHQLRLIEVDPSVEEFVDDPNRRVVAIEELLNQKRAVQKTGVALDAHLRRLSSSLYDLILPNCDVGNERYVQTAEVLPRHVTSRLWSMAYYAALLLATRIGFYQPKSMHALSNKTVATASHLIAEFLNYKLKEILGGGKRYLRRNLNMWAKTRTPLVLDMSKIYQRSRFVSAISSAFTESDNAWRRQGVCITVQGLNNITVESQNFRYKSSVAGKEGNFCEQRRTTADSYGFICPVTTPEGGDCGLRGELAMGCYITGGGFHLKGSVNQVLRRALEAHPLNRFIALKDVSGLPPQGWCLVWDDFGALLGWGESMEFVEEVFLGLKQTGQIHFDVTSGQCTQSNSWRIYTQPGRLVRPVIRLRGWRRLFEELSRSSPSAQPAEVLKMLVRAGAVDYIGTNSTSLRIVSHLTTELEATLATRHPDDIPQDLALEFSDVSLVSLCTAVAQFKFSHDQAPRVMYASNMRKQSIGRPGIITTCDYNYSTRSELYYPQYPITTTKTAVDTGLFFRTQDATQNLFLALLPFPENQEDAIVMNRRSLELGMFRHAEDIIVEIREKRNMTRLEVPHKAVTSRMKSGTYSKLGHNGLVKVGSFVSQGDVIIGRTYPIKEEGQKKRSRRRSKIRRVHVKFDDSGDPHIVKQDMIPVEDCSICVGPNQDGFVVDSQVFYEDSGIRVAQVRIRITRQPRIGDKFTSSHSQKGVIGKIMGPEDLPFSVDSGLVPDMICAPAGQFSRMTIGMIIELLFGKAAVASCQFGLGIDPQILSASFHSEYKVMQRILKHHGFSPLGSERFQDGKTGQMLRGHVMAGWIPIARLNHLSEVKCHARRRGPVDTITHEPVRGRSHNGGKRWGYMEIGALQSAGAAAIVRDGLVTRSGKCTLFICQRCKRHAMGNAVVEFKYCPHCKQGDSVVQTQQSRTSLVMVQELRSIGIDMKFHTDV